MTSTAEKLPFVGVPFQGDTWRRQHISGTAPEAACVGTEAPSGKEAWLAGTWPEALVERGVKEPAREKRGSGGGVCVPASACAVLSPPTALFAQQALSRAALARGRGRMAAAAAAAGEWEAPSRALRALSWLGQEFLSDWEAQDLRAALFQLLLLWLLLSLLGIQVAWRVYGNTVTGLYYRQGAGGQNGGTPDGSSHFSMWESSSNETLKTHRE